MRITFGNQYSSYIQDLGRTEQNMAEAQKLLTTGKQLNSLSDDPVALAGVLKMRGLKSGLEQYTKNLNSAKGQLGSSETSLDEAQSLIRRAYELSVSAANASTSQEARAAMSQEVTQIQSRLLDLANSQSPSGQYLFGGQKTDTKPFTLDTSGIVYNGDTNAVQIEVSPNQTMKVNTVANTLFTDAYNAISTLKSDLDGGNIPALGGSDLTALQTSDKSFGLARSEIGSKLTSISEQSDHHARRTDELTGLISNAEDADMSEAIVKYTQAQTAYQAALQSVSMGSRLSLVDFLQ